ncbi:MAG: hypothetical protein K0Q65_738 [Clostridia bacterium]|nr:hypothetical protein [Clostridia bacterium]
MIFDQVNVTVEGGLYGVVLPRMLKVKQRFKSNMIGDIELEIIKEIRSKVDMAALQGKRIAITAGSRGIKHIDKITLCVIKELKKAGAQPFIVPAMGSHGGATAEGQKNFLKNYDITEESMGIEIISSMETIQIDTLEDGVPVYCDKNAYESDGIVLINKIKPHADFKGDYESGLVKMMAIGLGKHKGATYLHKKGFDTFAELLPRVGVSFVKNAPVLFGLALVENAYDNPMMVEVIKSEDILSREKELLRVAKDNIAKIKFEDIDVLIIDEIGKNISGEGMDPNVTGRPGSYLNEGFEAPGIQKIVVLDVTEQSHGNGAGIGMCDISTIGCVQKINLGVMYTNSVTATILGPAKLPVMMNNDREAIAIALITCNRIDFNNPRIVRIKNTLELDEIEISEALIDYVKRSEDLEIISEPYEMPFDGTYRLAKL